MLSVSYYPKTDVMTDSTSASYKETGHKSGKFCSQNSCKCKMQYSKNSKTLLAQHTDLVIAVLRCKSNAA